MGTEREIKTADVGGISSAQLKQIIERIERLSEERKAIADDIANVYALAKGRGFDTKIIKKIIAMRRRDQQEIEEEETITELYMRALGMLPMFEEAEQPSRAHVHVQEGTVDEDVYLAAADLVRNENKASTSFLQRHLQIGYNHACRIMERMESENIVTKPDAVGKRSVISPRAKAAE